MSDDFKFPPVIVVTLAEEPWKGKQTSKHLNALEIEHTIHEGTQGVTIGLRATNPYDYDQHESPLFMHISQIGCVLSHRNALSVAIASGAPEYIVVEDDIKFPEKIKLMFQMFREALPPDAEVAQLAYRGEGDKPTEVVNDRVQRIFYPFCSSCIWWTREAAKKALVLLKPVDRPFDVMLIQKVFPFLNHYVPTRSIGDDLSNTKEWPSSVGDAPKIEA